MPRVSSAAPTTAVQIRSICTCADGALLAVERDEPVTTPIHHLLPDGSFAVAVPADHAVGHRARRADSSAVMELTDYAPVPLREPVRSLVWLQGRLRRVPPPAVHDLLALIAANDPNPALLQVDRPGARLAGAYDTHYLALRLQVESVVVADTSGAESVAVPALLAARPDPFCAVESCWLRHLDSAHHDVVARLASRLPAQLRPGQVRPLGLDRYGLRLRVEGDDGDRDVRLPFAQPVEDVIGLSRAIRVLMGCPFVNGLRARRC